MLTVTSITVTNQPGWYWLQFEGLKSKIKVNQDIVLEYSLAIGVEVDDDTLQQLKASAAYHRVRSNFINWSTLRLRSEKEIRDYLRSKKVDEQHWQEFIDLSQKTGNNDNDYAMSRARHRRQQFKSDRMIRFELQAQGLDSDQIDASIAALEHDETWAIEQLVGGRLAAKTPEKAREYLMRQGFSFDLVKQLTDQ